MAKVELVHAGALFDVFRDVDDHGARALKVPSLAGPPRSPAPACFRATAKLGGGSTVWDLITDVGPAVADDERRRAFLLDEADRIVASGGAWNHGGVILGPCARPDTGVETLGLRTTWFDGTQLGAMSRDMQRALFPRMLPSLWTALAAARHGDLSPSNLIVGNTRFALIDPGAMLIARRG